MKNESFWSSMVNSPLIHTWRGLTFEMLCLCHINRIKAVLGISDVSTNILLMERWEQRRKDTDRPPD